MKAYLRYASINTRDPERLAAFYKEHFGVYEIARSESGGIALTDSWFVIGLNAQWPDDEIEGVVRYGFAIDDVDSLRERLEQAGRGDELRLSGRPPEWGDWDLVDPQGMAWPISTRDFGLAGQSPRPFGVPRVRHCEISVGDTSAHLAWICDLLEFREIHTSIKLREAGIPFAIRQAGDDAMNVTFLPFDKVPGTRMSALQQSVGWVPQHFGWVVPDLYGLVSGLPLSFRTCWTAMGNMAEYQVHDPDGNAMDLSQTAGYEVGFDLWERGSGPGGPPTSIRLIKV